MCCILLFSSSVCVFFPPSSISPFLLSPVLFPPHFNCPSSRHLSVYIVFVLLHVFVCSVLPHDATLCFPPASTPVSSPVSPCASPWYVSSLCSLLFSLICTLLVFALCLTLLVATLFFVLGTC